MTLALRSRCHCGGRIDVVHGAPERSQWGRMPGARRIACIACGNPIDDVIGLLIAELARPHVDVSAELRELLVLVHPDRQWSTATELAHEITVHINAMRERIDEGDLERSK